MGKAIGLELLYLPSLIESPMVLSKSRRLRTFHSTQENKQRPKVLMEVISAHVGYSQRPKVLMQVIGAHVGYSQRPKVLMEVIGAHVGCSPQHFRSRLFPSLCPSYAQRGLPEWSKKPTFHGLTSSEVPKAQLPSSSVTSM